jgi:hypothetical protein
MHGQNKKWIVGFYETKHLRLDRKGGAKLTPHPVGDFLRFSRRSHRLF